MINSRSSLPPVGHGSLASDSSRNEDSEKSVPSSHLAPGEHRACVGDIDMFYRVLGTGPPLLLLHGGFETADYWPPTLLAQLSKHFTTIAIDSRGQGRTTGSDARITYAHMARDVVALLDHLDIAAAHLAGHSDGGCVALHLLVDFHDRITSATLIGTPYSTVNYPPAVFARLHNFIADARSGAAMREREALYRTMAPNPDYWPALLQKLGDAWLTEPRFTRDQLATIRRPVLVIDAGADQFLPSTVFQTLARALPNAKLYSLPAGTHNVAVEYPRELAAAIIGFINNA